MAALPHDRSRLLVEQGIPTELFVNSIDRWIETMIADDRSGEDIVPRIVNAKVIAKEIGVLCGHLIIDRLIQNYTNNCSLQWAVEEGGKVEPRDIVLLINGDSSEILKIERVLLNILGKLSGITTSTSKWVSASENIGIACTRKTEWGLLDKWAVHIGGGLTHRLDRKDALMLKENDFASAKKIYESIIETIGRVISEIDLRENSSFIIVEVQDEEQAITAAKMWMKLQNRNENIQPIVLLLDNMEIAEINSTIIKLESLDLRKWCILEGSGGISIDSISKWDKSGVDLISTSAVNRGAPPVDFSLIIEEAER
ncbi:MAG: hypothetical protein P8Q32_02960 [Candidatus Thalassarchaeaceae archaeon]|nr:hypothetical protein [Candidatus Thalassarchaeaceae archaeon]